MDIVVVLKQEEAKLQKQLKGIQGAIAALNGALHTPSSTQVVGHESVRRKRKMSAAARAKISKATKARWVRFRAERAQKSK